MPTAPTYPTIRTEIAGASVAKLASEFGTPTFVYDAAVIARRMADLAAFDVVRYAVKACSNLAVLDRIRRLGGLVDTVSAFEIRRAMAAGYAARGTPPPIVFTADVFDAASLDLVVREGVHVNCGSPDMIDQYGRLASGRAITLRINPGFGHGHSRKTNTGGDQSKHGIWHAELGACLARAKKHGLDVTGLHMHIGSGADMDHLAQVCQAMERAALEAGPGIHSVSAGGGLPIPYQSGESYVDLAAYHALWDATRKRLEQSFGHAVRLEVEPGRYLVAECGYLVTEIRAVKRQGDRLFYLVDAGFNNLARPILYGAYHPMSIVPGDGNANRPEHDVIVGGPLCESGDVFTQEEGGYVVPRRLPEAAVGELLVIECAGAYGAAMGSNYNSKPMAAEVLLLDGRARLVRRRQTFEELIQAESIPG
ncbi:MAG: diaminopimelate decarboxylase [Pirellulales bacterium]|nr:diaminopimelate decarboxylase [Pirellulales bacterium]